MVGKQVVKIQTFINLTILHRNVLPYGPSEISVWIFTKYGIYSTQTVVHEIIRVVSFFMNGAAVELLRKH